MAFRSMMTSLLNIETRVDNHTQVVSQEQASFFQRNRSIMGYRSSNTDALDEGGAKLSDAELDSLKVNEKLIVLQVESLIKLANGPINDELKN